MFQHCAVAAPQGEQAFSGLLGCGWHLADTEMDGHRPAFNMAFKELDLPFVWDEALYKDFWRSPADSAE